MQHGKATLERYLEQGIEVLQGAIDPADRIRIVLALLLYKRLSDQWDEEFEAADEPSAGGDGRGIHRFAIPEGCRWSDLRRCTSFLGKAVTGRLRAIEQHDPKLKGIFGDVDLCDPLRFSDPLLTRLFEHFDRLRLQRQDVDAQTLGGACERLRERFADEASQRDSGFFTPSAVARLMVAHLDPQPDSTIYDPVCGSGGLLLAAVRHLEAYGHRSGALAIHGDERNRDDTRRSLVLHDLEHADVRRADCLSEPRTGEPGRFRGEEALRQFDYVVGNPPFSIHWDPARWRATHRFDGHVVPTAGMSEFAHLLLMLRSLAPGGRMSVVMPPNVLFRRGAAAQIREHFVREDLLEAVVSLGPKLFIGTDTPVVLLFFRRDKEPDRRARVLLVRADDAYEPGRGQNVLSEVHLVHILAVMRRFADEPGFSRVVTLGELARNGYDLRMARYFDSDGRARSPSRASPRLPAGTVETTALDRAIAEARAVLERSRQSLHQTANRWWTSGPTATSVEHPDLGPLSRSLALVELDAMLVDDPSSLCNGVDKPKPKPVPKRNSRRDDPPRFGGGTPDELDLEALYIRQSNLDVDGFIRLEGAERVSLSGGQLRKDALRAGDLLLRRVHGSRCGTGALVPHASPPAICTSGIMRLRPEPSRIDPLLLLCWLHHTPVRRLIQRRLSTGVQVSLTQEALRSVPYPRVPLSEQRAVIPELRGLHDAVETASRTLSALLRSRETLVGKRRGVRPDRSTPGSG